MSARSSGYFLCRKTPVNCEADSFSVNSLSTFKQLLAREEETIFRFLVDTAGKLWFAFETRPHNKAPKHFQMTGDPLETACCLTAGNIKFKDKAGAVNKKYQPPQWRLSPVIPFITLANSNTSYQ